MSNSIIELYRQLDSHHKSWFGVVKLCGKLNTEVSIPQMWSIKQHTRCHTISIPLLYHLLVEFDACLSHHLRTALQGY